MINLMKNGLIIEDKHSFRDLGLIMTKKSISAPVPRIKTIDVPGADGQIDLSEVLTGRISYQMRQIKVTFYCSKKVLEVPLVMSDLYNEFQGKKVKLIFDDDPDFYWYGRVTFDVSYEKYTVVTLSATVDPFKYDLNQSSTDWLWDPFDFETGIINETTGITIDGEATITLAARRKSMAPVVTVTGSEEEMRLVYKGDSYTLTEGENKVFLQLDAGINELQFFGNGTVDVYYTGGML